MLKNVNKVYFQFIKIHCCFKEPKVHKLFCMVYIDDFERLFLTYPHYKQIFLLTDIKITHQVTSNKRTHEKFK